MRTPTRQVAALVTTGRLITAGCATTPQHRDDSGVAAAMRLVAHAATPTQFCALASRGLATFVGGEFRPTAPPAYRESSPRCRTGSSRSDTPTPTAASTSSTPSSDPPFPTPRAVLHGIERTRDRPNRRDGGTLRTTPARRALAVLLGVLGILLATLPAATPGAAAPRPLLWSSPVWIRSMESSECADGPGASVAPYVQVDQYPCLLGAQDEQWYLVGPSGAIDRQIRNRHSAMCLSDVFGTVEQRRCVTGVTYQLWETTVLDTWSDDTYVWIQNTSTLRCLSVANPFTSTRLRTTACTDAPTTRWRDYKAGRFVLTG